MAHDLVGRSNYPDVASQLLSDAADAFDALFKSPLTQTEAAALAAEQAKAAIPTETEHGMSKQLDALAATEEAAKVALDAATGARVKVQTAESARVAALKAEWWAQQAASPEYTAPGTVINEAVTRFNNAVAGGDGAEILSSFVAARVLGFELSMWASSVASAVGGTPPNVAVPATFDLLLDAAMTTVCRDAGEAYREAKLAELDTALARP